MKDRPIISLRVEASLLQEMDEFCKKEGKSRTALIKEAVRFYLANAPLRNRSEGFVPFMEYKKVTEELKEALRRISELEAEIATLRKENEALKEKLKKKRWFF